MVVVLDVLSQDVSKMTFDGVDEQHRRRDRDNDWL
jgi:hypothetical protein